MVPAPTRKSLQRRITWWGGDRRLVGFSGLTMLSLALTMVRGLGVFYGISILLPLVLFLAVVWVARETSKKDPWMVDIVMRQFRYQRYYAPKPDLGKAHPQIKDFA